MVTDPTVGNAAEIFTTKLALCARAWCWGKTRKQKMWNQASAEVNFVFIELPLHRHINLMDVKSSSVSFIQLWHISQTCEGFLNAVYYFFPPHTHIHTSCMCSRYSAVSSPLASAAQQQGERYHHDLTPVSVCPLWSYIISINWHVLRHV